MHVYQYSSFTVSQYIAVLCNKRWKSFSQKEWPQKHMKLQLNYYDSWKKILLLYYCNLMNIYKLHKGYLKKALVFPSNHLFHAHFIINTHFMIGNTILTSYNPFIFTNPKPSTGSSLRLHCLCCDMLAFSTSTWYALSCSICIFVQHSMAQMWEGTVAKLNACKCYIIRQGAGIYCE